MPAAQRPDQPILLNVRVRHPTPRTRKRHLPIPDLPDHVLLEIFKHLPPVPTLCHLAEVCTSWKKVALSPQLWSHVTASDAYTRQKISEQTHENYQYVCYRKGATIRDDDSDSDGEPPPAKRRADMRRWRGVPPAVKVITARAASKLRVLDLRNCYPMSTDDAFQMTNNELALIADRAAHSLQDLSISPWNCITGHAVLQLASACTQLRKLHVLSCRSMSISMLGSIVRKCPLLQDLSVSSCSAFRGYDLVEKIRPIRHTIRRLDISDTSTAGLHLRHLLCDFPVLEQLVADNCEYLHLGGPPPGRLYLSTVHSNLQSVSINKICHISVGWLRVIYRLCPKLQLLALNQPKVANFNPIDLFEGHLPPLQHLSIAGMPLKDNMWQCIFERLGPTLLQCDVSRNTNFSGALVTNGFHSFSLLEDLNVSTTAINLEALLVLFTVAPKLKFLDATGCRSLNRQYRKDPLSLRRANHGKNAAVSV